MLSFVSTLVLVRLLDPHAFGTVAVGMTLLAVFSQIQESGPRAPRSSTDATDDPKVAASSVLVFAAVAGFALTVVTLALAPLYTRLLHVPDSTRFVQALALVLAIRGLSVVPGAILERELDFRSRARADLSGGAVQTAVAVGCAAAGLGAWSLVAGFLAGAATQGLVMWFRTPWRPSPFGASRSMLREMLRYGRFVTLTNVMVLVNTNVDNATVARFLGTGPLGVYNVAWRLAGLPNTVIGLIVGRVMFSRLLPAAARPRRGSCRLPAEPAADDAARAPRHRDDRPRRRTDRARTARLRSGKAPSDRSACSPSTASCACSSRPPASCSRASDART